MVHRAKPAWQRSRTWAWLGLLVGWAVGLGLIVVRVVWGLNGTLQAPELAWSATALLGAWLLGMTWASLQMTRNEDRGGRMAALFALPVAAVAAAQLASPTTVPEAGEPACRGAAVAGGDYFATTSDRGVNSRSGPSTAHPQVDRYGVNCTMSFVGFCVGEPAEDFLVNDVADQRWLIVHEPALRHRFEVVSAAKVLAQDAETNLGRAPDPRCRSHGGWAAPSAVKLSAKLRDGVVKLSIRSKHALYIGIAVATERTLDGQDNPFPLASTGPKPAETPTTSATWEAAATAKLAGTRATRMTVFVSPCYALGVPQLDNHDSASFVAVRGAIKPAASRPLDQKTRDAMAAAACRVAPDYPEAVRGTSGQG